MIPVRLKMRNFMCYRDNVPDILFEGIHTAVISGDNGTGKSAIIDAITWALWGKARAKSSDDDLIHQNQPEMLVEFDFTAGDNLYRIIRRRSRAKKPGSPGTGGLDLLVSNSGNFSPLSGDTMLQSQQKINDILHMDYDTFINSSYLRQGHADEFTRQTPSKRKEVLAGILQLDIYDQYTEKAKEEVRARENTKLNLENLIKAMQDDLLQKPVYEAEFTRISGERAALEQTIKIQESTLEQSRLEKERLESKRTLLNQLDQRTQEKERELQNWTLQVQEHAGHIKEFELVINRRQEIETGFVSFTATRNLCAGLDNKLSLVFSLSEKKRLLEQSIAREKEKLSGAIAVAQNRLKELLQKADKLDLFKSGLDILAKDTAKFEEKEAGLLKKKQECREQQTKLNGLESNRASLEREAVQIKEKINLLSTQTETKCPVCESDLSTEACTHILEKYRTDVRTNTIALKQTITEVAALSKQLNIELNGISVIESGLNKERAALKAKEALLQKDIADAEAAVKQVKELGRQIEELGTRLESENCAPAETAAFQQIEKQLNELGYNRDAHEQARQHIAALQKYEELHRKLVDADASIVREKEALTRIESLTAGLTRALQADTENKKGLNNELAALPAATAALTRAQDELRTLSEKNKRLQQEFGSVEARLQQCLRLEARKKERETELNEVSRETGIYRTLAEAFGKKGIQAWLIEKAIPEISAEANRLLGRMTDNRMFVKIATQKETKKGDVTETLDIEIADELGTRRYEMFSGGEAFRIDFAIRIAISRLLARRAGAPLPILIIDEGFGTQDNTGLEKLVEAITSIQDDFDKILVITHIDELKDAFPVRINVVKTAEGSTISVE